VSIVSCPSEIRGTDLLTGKRVEAWGPKDAKIVIVAEAPGETEERLGRPLCGASGELLREMLGIAGIDMDECYLTNVFKTRPPGNKIELWCCKKSELPSDYPADIPAFGTGKYFKPEYLHYRSELHKELSELSPNLIILAGNAALWAFDMPSVGRSRGVVASSKWGKVLPIYHPAAVLRNWSWRPITITDLQKAAYESGFPEIRYIERELWIEPTLQEVHEYFSNYLDPATLVSCDIETNKTGITCVALAPSAQSAICIPLWDPLKPDQSYWTFEEERVVWGRLKQLLRTRVLIPKDQGGVELLGQNFLFDVQHLVEYGVKIPRVDHDTMLKHHAMYPGMLKGLGFLASIYTNERSWKHMVKDGEERDK
jgi:uracil-DNA glycosylase